MSVYTFTETPETFARDYEASWLLFGQVFITNAGKDRTPIVLDPARIIVKSRTDAGGIEGGYLLALAIVVAVALVYLAVAVQAVR